jgi:tetratricopeptide (TPR) repeat protein
MKLLVCLILFTVLLNTAFAQSANDRRQKILEIINEELSEVERLNATQKGNPDNLLRMAELNLEKARLIKEKENDEYLAIPANKRAGINKTNFFKVSTSYFNKASNICNTLIKGYPKYRNIGDAYYILAYNAKETGDYNTATKYFSAATKSSSSNSKTAVKSKISQAEIHYNQKQYKNAIPLYEQALNVNQDKWWTKDAFNLAWCYYHLNNYPKAIATMNQVYNKSKDKKYINMSREVERDIGLFYATSGRVDEGIAFYKKININFADRLITIAQVLVKNGQQTNAEKVYNEALKYQKDEKKIVEIHLEKLKLYNQFGKIESHLSTSQILLKYYEKGHINSQGLKVYQYEVAKQAAVLQKQVAGKTYASLRKIRLNKANQAIAYFEILKKIDASKQEEHIFHQGETSYAVAKYAESIDYYFEAYELAVKKKNNQIIKNSIDGMLAALGQKGLNEKDREKNYERVYLAYLSIDQSSEKAKIIYEKLFRVYFDQKHYDKAEKVLKSYAKNYPKDFKGQEAMLANLMDASRAQKDNAKVRGWIAEIDAGKYVVSTQYAQKLRELLTSMQMEDVQQSLKSGDKKTALLGYHKILEDKNSTERARINAQYNLAALYYELGDIGQSYKWSAEALKNMDAKDVVEYADSFLAISNYMFSRLQFVPAADVSLRLLVKLCGSNDSKKNVAFKNSFYLYLAEGDLEKSQEIYDYAKKCNISKSYLREAAFELADEYYDKKLIARLESIATELSQDAEAFGKLIYYYSLLASEYQKMGQSEQYLKYTKGINQLYQVAKTKRIPLSVESTEIIALESLRKIHSYLSQINNQPLVFPEQTYNNLLKDKLGKLNVIASEMKNLKQLGAPEGIVKGYILQITAFENLSQQISDFTPPDKSEDYKASFKKGMESVYLPLASQAKELKFEAQKVISDNNIIVPASKELYLLENQDGVEFRYAKGAVLMDRGGRR